MGTRKQLKLAGFLFSGQNSQSWRVERFTAHDSLDIDYFIDYAQLAESAGIETLFLADGASFPSGAREVTQAMWSVSVFEPVTLMAALAARTSHIGLIYTASVADNEPTHLARQLVSLDHISRGRAGWNVVTTPGPGGPNLGIAEPDAADRKYDRARAFLQTTTALFDSFEDDALPRDKRTGVYVDLDKVHAPQIDNGFYRASQPLKIERAPQGHPVIAQAGTSEEGLAFGAETADVIYCANYSIADGQRTWRAIKDRAVAAGRRPEDVVLLTGAAVVWGETQEEAEAKLDEVASLWPIEVAMQNMAIDFPGYDLDDLFPEDYVPRFSKGRSSAIARDALANGLTIRQAAHRVSVGLGHRPVVGTTQSIADDFEAWLEAEATDGFALIQPRLIDGLHDVVNHVIPELKRRGIFLGEYPGATLRENLGLRRPVNTNVRLRGESVGITDKRHSSSRAG
ncbi:NtaA/DmoA family FMN-dependent monooxygenase [Aureimonas sp. ME7]|uniref:NtaA/DmoA family FMN-dependent monooxygenase n=1 Tax=Aureimonas sp. ME7 TaxID=2744252 RepID=UPI0015F6A121|nr:NtaA/DmoA family FMN-dependent monooxygenase [Aureimonas sp. ME7]